MPDLDAVELTNGRSMQFDLLTPPSTTPIFCFSHTDPDLCVPYCYFYCILVSELCCYGGQAIPWKHKLFLIAIG